MKNDLQILIHELQAEYDMIKSSLERSVLEQNYGEAVILENAKNYIGQKLSTLRKLENPYSYTIQHYKIRIDQLQNDLLEFKDHPDICNRFLRQISDFENKIKELESQLPIVHQDSHKVIDAIERVVRGTYESALLVLGEDEITFTFHKDNHDLQILIEIKQKMQNRKKLTGFGFDFMDGIFKRKVALNESLELISLVIYDVFRGQHRKARLILNK